MCPARAASRGLAKVHKLSSNESPLGPSPRAIEAFRASAEQLAFYPDGSARLLREAIGRRYGLDAEQIICGNGSDELICAPRPRLSAPGRRRALQPVRLSRISRSPSARPARSRSPRRRRAETADVDAMLAKVGARTKIVFLANPEQPDRHLPAVLRGQAAACGPAGRRVAGARRGLCRICRAQRLRRGHRAASRRRRTS